MSPVLKKRHSKSYVPLFSKNQGFALLHIPFLSTFLQSKKQLPFRNCFSVYSLFYYFIFRNHFRYHVVLYQQKRFLLKLLQMKYYTPLHIIRHGFKVQRRINRMQLFLCVIRFTNHIPKVNHTILRFRCERLCILGNFYRLITFCAIIDGNILPLFRKNGVAHGGKMHRVQPLF